VGTSGARGVILSEKGDIVESSSVSHDFRIPRFGWAEQDAEVYWDSFCKVVSSLTAKSGIKNVDGIGISGLTPDCLPVDSQGNPLAPAILWLDRRASTEAEWVKRNLGEEHILQITGNGIDSYFGLVKLLWLKNNMTDLYARAYKFLNVKDFIVGRITGEFVSDYSDAALWGIAFDIKKKCWSEDILDEIDIDIRKLPELYRSDHVVGKVNMEVAAAVGILEGTPVIVGAPDGFANLVSLGVVSVGDSGMSLGTSGVWGVLHNQERFSREILTCPSASDPDILVSLAALAISGGVHRWFRDTVATAEKFSGGLLGVEPYNIMELEAIESPPGAKGLFLLPYFAGERTPIWDPAARGVLFGLSLIHNRGDIYRSIFEGIAYAFLNNWEFMEKMGLRLPGTVRLSGSGAKSKLLRRILADVLNTTVVLVENLGGAEVGDAFLAGKGVGIFEDFEVLRGKLKVIGREIPDVELNEFYKDRYERVYKRIYPALKDLFAEVHNMEKF